MCGEANQTVFLPAPHLSLDEIVLPGIVTPAFQASRTRHRVALHPYLLILFPCVSVSLCAIALYRLSARIDGLFLAEEPAEELRAFP
jgi:hypothetical protein